MLPSVLVLSDYHDLVSVRPEAELFVALARAGFPVTVMTRPASPYRPRLEAAGVRVIEWLPRRKWSGTEVRRLRAELRRGGHRVMVLSDNKALYCGPWAAVGRPVKVVAYRGYDGNVDWYDPTNYLKLLHPRIDAYWANAESVRATIQRNLLFRSKDRVVAIPKGHDVAWYEGTLPLDRAALGIPADAFAVGFVANVRPMKGVPDLLRATAFIRPERGLHLVFAGAGMDTPALAALVAASPMRERIHVLGPRRDAVNLLAACDAYVCSSYQGESLTKSLLEAMCLGVPPVVTDVPGNRGIVVDGQCGRVVPPRDPEALGRALDDLASDRARAKAWGAAARAQIQERWSHAGAVRQMTALVERLAGEPG
jgi:glycosyltransferase involved in cell wall biosynthesis